MRALPLAVSLLVTLAWAGPAFAQLAPAPAPAAAPGADGSTLSAGGLAPPPAVETAPPATETAPPGTATPESTEQNLARADREDSGRGLEFGWLNAEVGVMHLGLGTFSEKNLLDARDVRPKQTAVVAGLGAGVRLVFLTLGARFRYSEMPDLRFWSLGAEGGIHAPFGALEPYGVLNLGYVSLSHFAGAAADGVKVWGFDARLGGGVDYYLTNLFSVGANVSADLLLLKRTVTVCPDAAGGTPVLATGGYCSTGSSTGGAVTATAVAGLHF